MDQSLVGTVEFVEKTGVIALLIAILVGGAKQWWVFGHQYREMRAERDHWQQLALSGHSLSKRAVTVLAETVRDPAS